MIGMIIIQLDDFVFWEKDDRKNSVMQEDKWINKRRIIADKRSCKKNELGRL